MRPPIIPAPRFARCSRALLICLASVWLMGCQSAYYATMERLGVPKRAILAERVEEARDSQQEAKEQFASALDRFDAVLGLEGGALEDKYRTLAAEYEESAERAEEVRERIRLVEDVAGALFDEWRDELDEYESRELRARSKERLRETRRRYERLVQAMRKAEARMDPVLETFQDQVLYLKHNLNARAVASLAGELSAVEADVAALVRAMEASIREADEFIAAMERQAG